MTNERIHTGNVRRLRRPGRGPWGLWLAVSVFFSAVELPAQIKSPADRLDELEKEVAGLKKELARLSKEKTDKKKEDEEFFAGGLVLLGGTKLRLGGQMELRFIDSEKGSFGPLGAAGFTEEPDPHLNLQQLRLEPEIELNRWISVRGQIDLEPEQGRTLLKELTARHDVEPEWWFDSRFQIGLDDRFMRPSRRTETYPLLGNAFWRDESLAFTWRLTFGDKDGPPEDDGGRGNRGGRDVGSDASEEALVGSAKTGASWTDAFDFARNWGEARLYLSLGQGYRLDTNEVGFDKAAFNDLVQDDRDLATDLSLRELGIGLGYRRSFLQYGEFGVLGFYYNDELRDASIAFLQGDDMTVRDLAGNALSGYGDSRSDRSYRYGVNVEYFLPSETVLGDFLGAVRRRDGLRLFFQYLRSVDGRLEREGWYVQGSWRVSFGRLLFDRYFRSIEPVVRYGVFDVDVPLGRSPLLPGTWDRRELLFGAIIEVTGDIFIKAEYTFHDETTGAGDVDNDELLVEILLEF